MVDDPGTETFCCPLTTVAEKAPATSLNEPPVKVPSLTVPTSAWAPDGMHSGTNDPDGWVWMLIYGYAVGVTLLAITGRYGVWAFIGALVYLLMSIWWMPWDQVNDQLFGMPQWHMGPDSNEEAREAGGLFIMALWLFVVSWWWLKGRKKNA